jgi:arylsulfatase A-like enzyme
MASNAIRLITSAVAGSALVTALLASSSTAASSRPLCEGCNVVLLSVDTVRADHLSLYGYERETSPNIDHFASQAVVFTNAMSQAAWTLPGHGAMMTGLYPSRLGVTHYPALRKLPDVNEFLPEVLREAGYATGSFNGGGFVSDHYGFDRGFDVYQSKGRRFEHNMKDTLAWLEENKDHKFFLFLHGYNAHRPYYSAKPDKLAMGLGGTDPQEDVKYCLKDSRDHPGEEGLDRILRYYDASIRHGDRQLAPFFKALRRFGLDKNTVVLITSDHGEEFFEHGNCDHVRFTYRESIHVPYILYIPGYSPKGRKIDGLMPASISVARTLLDTVGLPHNMPGVSLLPMLDGSEREFPIVYAEADSPAGNLGSRGANIAAIRPEAKLISFTDEGSDEAFDVVADEAEQKVLPEGHDAYYLRQSLRAWSSAMGSLPRPRRPRKGGPGSKGSSGESVGGDADPDADNPGLTMAERRKAERERARARKRAAAKAEATAGKADGKGDEAGAADDAKAAKKGAKAGADPGPDDDNGKSRNPTGARAGNRAMLVVPPAPGTADTPESPAAQTPGVESPSDGGAAKGAPEGDRASSDVEKQGPKTTPTTTLGDDEEPEEIPDELRDQLKSLGYLEE